MLILIIVPSISQGGAEHQALLLSKLLSTTHDVVVLTKYNKHNSISNGIIRRIEDNLSLLIRIIQVFITSKKVAYVVSFLPQSHYYSIIAKLFFSTKLITAIRNDLRYYRSGLEDIHSWRFNILDYFTDIYTVQNEDVARTLRWKGTRKRISIIPNMLSLAGDQEKIVTVNNNNRHGITIVQRLSWQKDPLYMIKLCQLINSEIQIDIIGNGEYYSLVKNKLTDYRNISVHGLLSEDEVRRKMSTSLLGLLTSFYEGMPNVITEYIFNGCIPLSTSNHYIHSILDHLNLDLNLILTGVDIYRDAATINNIYSSLNHDLTRRIELQRKLLSKLKSFHDQELIHSQWVSLLESE